MTHLLESALMPVPHSLRIFVLRLLPQLLKPLFVNSRPQQRGDDLIAASAAGRRRSSPMRSPERFSPSSARLLWETPFMPAKFVWFPAAVSLPFPFLAAALSMAVGKP
ncbi:hypothetical protein [Bradyrhizobium sp.]|uniref:hypothetical protein n=1 Tax=Bradyrhizobium sp. TaxID=376 RepID=UPI00403815B6